MKSAPDSLNALGSHYGKNGPDQLGYQMLLNFLFNCEMITFNLRGELKYSVVEKIFTVVSLKITREKMKKIQIDF